MNTGQVVFVIIAFIFLSTLMLNFNRTTAFGTGSVDYAQRGILLTTVSTSYGEIIRGLSFDENSDSNWVPSDQLNLLTAPNRLGPESAAEDSIRLMNDVDDFNGQTFDKAIPGTGKIFRSTFRVRYVDPQNPSTIAAHQTLVKQIEISTWQISPGVLTPMPGDTLHSQMLVGYFHFN